ncbi:MAG: nucleoside monophosphate kinase [Planctomycetota bacterium]|nr:nucleoside monophosphate kinase [Planctomycetota bacterium]
MDSGALVPDELIIDMLLERLSKPDCEKGYMLDGFPRTIVQAQALDKKFAEQDESIDLVLFFDSDPEIIVVRMSGRRTCPDCGAVYHVDNNPPKLKGICDECGGQLITREDDKPQTVRKRLDNYFELTEPLVSHYRKQGLVHDIEADKPIPEIKEEVGQLMRKLLEK